jgi:hypothetical protein
MLTVVAATSEMAKSSCLVGQLVFPIAIDYKAAIIALYAGFGLKLESKRRGVLADLQESWSRTPHTVMPTHFG